MNICGVFAQIININLLLAFRLIDKAFKSFFKFNNLYKELVHLASLTLVSIVSTRNAINYVHVKQTTQLEDLAWYFSSAFKLSDLKLSPDGTYHSN